MSPGFSKKNFLTVERSERHLNLYRAVLGLTNKFPLHSSYLRTLGNETRFFNKTPLALQICIEFSQDTFRLCLK